MTVAWLIPLTVALYTLVLLDHFDPLSWDPLFRMQELVDIFLEKERIGCGSFSYVFQCGFPDLLGVLRDLASVDVLDHL